MKLKKKKFQKNKPLAQRPKAHPIRNVSTKFILPYGVFFEQHKEVKRMNKYDNIPDEMKSLKRFVGWRKEERKDKSGNIKVAKIPYSLIDGKSQDWNKKYRWLDYETAITKKEQLGFVLGEDNIICIDLDNAISNDLLKEEPKAIIDKFKGTYMELSQSRSGIHIFLKGNIKDNLIRPSDGIEIYHKNHYIALTGDTGDGRYFPISNVLLNKNEEINELIEKWTQKKPSTLKQIREYRYEPINNLSRVDDLSIDEILSTMERTNIKANRLISGVSLTGDHSRDDFIFLILARNYTNGNPSLMKELFLITPLNRLGSNEKRRDDRKYLEYVDKTIESVLGLGNFVAFDWSKHLQYKKRMKAYERI